MKVYAIEHAHGLSLFRARTMQGALRKAKRVFGTNGAPYRLAKDQVAEITYARSMGAVVY